MLSTVLQLCIVIVMQIKLTVVVVVVVGLQAHFLTFCFARLLFVSDFVALSRSKERILFESFFSPPSPPRATL